MKISCGDLRIRMEPQKVPSVSADFVLHEVLKSHILDSTGVHPLPDGALCGVTVVVDVRRW